MGKIVTAPKYGIYLGKGWKTLLIVLASVFTIGITVVCIGAIVSALTEGWTKDDIISLVVGVIIIAVVDAFILWILIKQLIFEKNFKLWKKDFVQLYAKVSAGFVPDNVFEGVGITLVYRFKYNGQIHEIKGKAVHSSRFVNENKIFKSVGEKIPIYYSPTYDKVVFVEEKDSIFSVKEDIFN